RPATTGTAVAGQTATIGFWQNKNGQNLILSLNGGATTTQLGHWLALTFPNLYASLDCKTNADVAAFYKTLFARTAQTAPGGPPRRSRGGLPDVGQRLVLGHQGGGRHLTTEGGAGGGAGDPRPPAVVARLLAGPRSRRARRPVKRGDTTCMMDRMCIMRTMN